MVLGNFACEERRKNVGQVDLLGALKVAASQVEVLTHGGELDILGAENVPELAQRFFRTHV